VIKSRSECKELAYPLPATTFAHGAEGNNPFRVLREFMIKAHFKTLKMEWAFQFLK